METLVNGCWKDMCYIASSGKGCTLFFKKIYGIWHEAYHRWCASFVGAYLKTCNQPFSVAFGKQLWQSCQPWSTKKRWEKLQMQLRPSRDGYQRHFRGVGWVRGHQNPFTGGVDFHPPRSYKGWCARLCTKLFFACTLTDQNGLPGKQTLATSWWLTGRNRKAFAQKQTWEWTWRSWSDCQVKLEGKKTLRIYQDESSQRRGQLSYLPKNLTFLLWSLTRIHKQHVQHLYMFSNLGTPIFSINNYGYHFYQVLYLASGWNLSEPLPHSQPTAYI